MEVEEQLCVLDTKLSQSWWQAPFSTEPFHRPQLPFSLGINQGFISEFPIGLLIKGSGKFGGNDKVTSLFHVVYFIGMSMFKRDMRNRGGGGSKNHQKWHLIPQMW